VRIKMVDTIDRMFPATPVVLSAPNHRRSTGYSSQ
jgi:hypothetical protein